MIQKPGDHAQWIHGVLGNRPLSASLGTTRPFNHLQSACLLPSPLPADQRPTCIHQPARAPDRHSRLQVYVACMLASVSPIFIISNYRKEPGHTRPKSPDSTEPRVFNLCPIFKGREKWQLLMGQGHSEQERLCAEKP